MKTQQYPNRLPQLRVSDDILEKLKGLAQAHQITLAEAHRQVLARGLEPGPNREINGVAGGRVTRQPGR